MNITDEGICNCIWIWCVCCVVESFALKNLKFQLDSKLFVVKCRGVLNWDDAEWYGHQICLLFLLQALEVH